MMTSRWASWVTPGAWMLLVGTMAKFGLLETTEGLWFSLAVLLAFGPSGWIAPGGWRRRAAEALLLPAAVVVTLVSSPVMRQMMAAPLVFLAAWAAWSAAVRRAPGRSTRIAATVFFGLAARMLVGYGGVAGGWVGLSGVIAASAVVPGAVAAISAPLALVAVVVTLGTTIEVGASGPWLAAVLIVALAAVVGRSAQGRHAERIDRFFQGLVGWYSGLGAVAMMVVALGAWGLPAVGEIMPGLNWIGVAVVFVIAAAAIRLPSAAGGACMVLACLVIAPPLVTTPEGGGVRLGPEEAGIPLRVGNGSPYVLDIMAENLEKVRDGAKVVTVFLGSKKVVMRVHLGPDGEATLESSRVKCGYESSNVGVWRPGRTWRRAERFVLDVDEGVVPVIQRREGLSKKVAVHLAASGPSKPSAPRDIEAEHWFWSAAAVVALLQLLSGLWSRKEAWHPWMLLIVGLIGTRAAVEPFHLLIERHCIDLCLAAVLLAWVPLASEWVRKGRVFFAVGLFLVPMALATPHLTPSLWGDEPYHIALMESVVEDGDFDLENNLVGGGAVREAVLSSSHLFHSPVVAGILLPGFLAAGRAGALILLALGGAGVVALVVRRFRRLGRPPDRAVVMLVLVACLTFPLVTFSTQIWPGMVGALVVAAMLLLVSKGLGARFIAAALALLAIAAKTRLALVVLPVALAGLWREKARARVVGGAAIGAAAALALVVGWMTMGHPFGLYRRLHHLVPEDLGLVFRVIGGLLFDVAGGLAWTAPLWIVAFAVFPFLWKRGGDGERALLVGGVATLLALLHSIEWYGGGSPPARYLFPMLPAVLLALGLLVLQPNGKRRLVFFLFPVSLAPWWAFVTRPHFSVNPGDGRWWLTNALSRRFAADARALFPSFLTPTVATWIVPLVLIVGCGLLWWVVKSPRRAWWLTRVGPAVWLIAALGLVLAVDLRADTVVEVESAQIRRHGGAPAPPTGTPSRYSHPNGWLLGGGDGLTVPLNLRGDERVDLELRVVPPGWVGTLGVRWNDGDKTEIKVKRAPEPVIVTMPAPPGPGRNRLSLRWAATKDSVLFVDRALVSRE